MSDNLSSALDLPVSVANVDLRLNSRVVGLATGVLLAGTVYLARAVDWRHAVLFLTGAAAGLILYHAAFGFTSSFRLLLVEHRGAGLRGQMLMLGLAFALFLPGLAAGELFGQPVSGSTAPFGIPVAAGAFIFGIGMQLGGG